MPSPVVSGAVCACTMGTMPGQLTATSRPAVRIAGQPAATVADAGPGANLTGFGLCTSLGNPLVAAATAAALGVLTPQRCTPAPAGGWVCPGTVRVGGVPLLTGEGCLVCAFGGSITIKNPGQARVRL